MDQPTAPATPEAPTDPAEDPDPDAALGKVIGTYHVKLTLRGDPAEGPAPTLGPVETAIEQVIASTFPGVTARARAEHT